MAEDYKDKEKVEEQAEKIKTELGDAWVPSAMPGYDGKYIARADFENVNLVEEAREDGTIRYSAYYAGSIGWGATPLGALEALKVSLEEEVARANESVLYIDGVLDEAKKLKP